MTYDIYTSNATELIDKVFFCCNNKKDQNGREINTWDVTKTKYGTEVLIHTTNQWEEKCNIHLDQTPENNVVVVSARYWSKFPKVQRTGIELDFVLGRFTELMLVHFNGAFDSIVINT